MPKLKHPTQINVTTFNTCSQSDYKLYKEESNHKVSYEMYKKINVLANTFLSDKILEGKRIKLPFGLSDVFINKYKQEIKNKDGRLNLPIDWKKSKELGKRVYHLNHHTDGFTFKWFWAKSDAKFKFKELWAFKAVRKNTRAINKIVKEGEVEYKQYVNTKATKKVKVDYSNIPVNEYDAKTNKVIKVWNNRLECINHYEITLNYFNKLVALPQKRWLRGKSYLKYATQDG
jgi:hypothetical protein